MNKKKLETFKDLALTTLFVAATFLVVQFALLTVKLNTITDAAVQATQALQHQVDALNEANGQ